MEPPPIENDPADLDDRSPMAKAMDWVSRIVAVALMMVLPALGGYWLDQVSGTVVLFTLLGLGFGMLSGIWQLVKLAHQAEQNEEKVNETKSGRPP